MVQWGFLLHGRQQLRTLDEDWRSPRAGSYKALARINMATSLWEGVKPEGIAPMNGTYYKYRVPRYPAMEQSTDGVGMGWTSPVTRKTNWKFTVEQEVKTTR